MEGFVNIDFPLSEHSVQANSTADLYADITRLSYEPETVSEIRLHHVFEHFDRPTALRLLVEWQAWLELGGLLVIETPDFERCARAFVSRRGRARRGVLLRHMFGSHEASWAVHYDGWYEERFRRTLGAIGYTIIKVEHARWRSTFNITVFAQKNEAREPAHQVAQAEMLLRGSMVDSSASEQRLLTYWTQRIQSDLPTASDG